MSTVDRILELLDNAGQQTGEQAYGDFDRDACWRCGGPPGEGASGVCDGCRVVLLDDVDTAPAGITVAELGRAYASAYARVRDYWQAEVAPRLPPWQAEMAERVLRRVEELNQRDVEHNDWVMATWMAYASLPAPDGSEYRVPIARPPRFADYNGS